MAWRLLEHTADAGFEAEADTLAEVFLDAAEAFLFLAAGLTPGDFPGSGEKSELFLSSPDGEELAVSWLNELPLHGGDAVGIFSPREGHCVLSPPSHCCLGKNRPLNGRVLSVKAATYGGLVLRTSPRPFLRMILDL